MICKQLLTSGLWRLLTCMTLAFGVATAAELLTERCGPEVGLYGDLSERIYEWNHRTMLGDYRRFHPEQFRGRDRGEQLIDYWLNRFSGRAVDLTDQELRQLAERTLITPAANDGLVLYCLGKSFQVANEPGKAMDFYREVADNLQESDYANARKLFALRRSLEFLVRNRMHDEELVRDNIGRQMATLVDCFDSGEYAGIERLMLIHFCDTDVGRFNATVERQWLTSFFQVMAAQPENWLTLTMVGWGHYEMATNYKTAYRFDAGVDNPREFYAMHLDMAEQALQAAWELQPNEPTAAMFLIAVATERREPTVARQWFDRATSVEFDLRGAHYRYRQAVRGRSGGSPQQALSFGLECAATKRFDTKVPLYLLYSLMDAFQDANDFGDDDFVQSCIDNPDIWPMVEQVLDHYIAQPPIGADPDVYRQYYVALAWKFKQEAKALAMAEQLDLKLKRYAFTSYVVRGMDVLDAAYAARLEKNPLVLQKGSGD